MADVHPHVRDPELAHPDLLGNRPISTQARVAALDCVMDEMGGSKLGLDQTDMVIDYAAARFERGEIEGALATLTMITDRTGAYRLAAVLHTEAS